MNPVLARRVIAVLVDGATLIACWTAVAFVILQFLVWRHPDNPWGSLAFAIMLGFPIATAILAAWEGATNQSVGRAAAQLRLIGSSGSPLTSARQGVRGVLKWAVVVGLALLAAKIDSGSLWTLTVPFLLYGGLNALVCMDRPDGRSILDVIVGSRSVPLHP